MHLKNFSIKIYIKEISARDEFRRFTERQL